MSASVVTDEEVLQETDEYFGYGPKLQEDPQPPLDRYVDEVLGDVLATLLRSEKNRWTGKRLSYYDRAEVFIQLETTVLIPGIIKAAGVTSAGVGLADDAVGMADDAVGVVDDLAEEAAKSAVDWKVAPHGKMPSPRPSGYQSHHGVNSVMGRSKYRRIYCEKCSCDSHEK